jgi:autotransporter translocation and assembly factor TamB
MYRSGAWRARGVYRMNVLKKILIVLLGIVVLLTAAVAVSLKTGIFTEKAKEFAQAEIAKLTGKSIGIEKIELGIFNNIVIRNVSIPLKRTAAEGGEFISVGSIIFRFNLVDLLIYKKDIDKTLSHVIVESPVAHIKKENGKFNIGDFINSFTFSGSGISSTAEAAPKIALPVNRVLVENGKILYDDVDKKFTAELSSIKGSFTYRQKSNNIKIYLAGKTPGGEKLGIDNRNIKLDLTYFLSGGGFKGSIQVKDEGLAKWLPYALPDGACGINSGVFSLDLGAEGEEFTPGKFKMQGECSVSKGSLTAPGGLTADNIEASASVLNDRVNIKKMVFDLGGGRVEAKGDIKDIFGKIGYEATAAFAGIDASNINKDILEGRVSGAAGIKGDKNSTAADGNLIWETGKLAGISVKDLEAVSAFDGKTLELKEINGELGNGRISGSGSIMLSGKNKKMKTGINIAVNGMDASALFRDRLDKGKIDAGIKLSGTIADPKLQAVLRSDKIDLNGTPAAAIKGNLIVTKELASLDSSFDYASYKGLSLSGMLEFKEGMIKLTSFELKEGGKILAGAAGSYMTKDKTIDMLSTVTGISIPALGIKALANKDVEGKLSGSFVIKGTTEEPDMEAVIESRDLKIKGVPQPLKATMDYGGDMVKISGLSFGDSLSGSGEFSVKKKIFNLNLDMKKMDGVVLKELTGLKIFDNSRIDGSAVIKKEKTGYGGSITIAAAYSKGDYKSVDIEITGDKNEFSINKAYIRQKQGTLTLDGGAKVTDAGALSAFLRGSMKDYKFNDKLKKVSDEFSQDSVMTRTDRGWITQSRVNFTKIVMNDEPMDDLAVTMKTAGDSVPEFTFKWGDEYNAAGSFTGGDEPEINMTAELKSADLMPVYAILGKRDRGLDEDSVVTGKFEFKGPLYNAQISGSLAQKKGTAGVSGGITFKKQNLYYLPDSVNLQYNLVNVDIKNFAGIFDQTFKQTGRANGKGDLKGKLDSLESSGNMQLSDGKLLDMPFDSVDAKYAYRNKIISLERLIFDYKKTGFTVLDSKLEIKDNNVYQASIKSEMKDFMLKGNLLNGNLNFDGRIDNFSGLNIDGALSSGNFRFKNHMFQPFVLKTTYGRDGVTLRTSQGKTKLSAVIKNTDDTVTFDDMYLENEKGEQYLTVSGYVAKEKGDSQLLISGQGADPQMINDLLGWDHRWSGSADGSVKISGNAKDGLAYTIQVEVKNGMVDDLDFDTFSGIVVYKADWVDLSPIGPLVLSKNDKYDVKIAGKIPAPMTDAAEEKLKGASMDLRASIKNGDLSVIKMLKWVDDAQGPMNLDLKITGTKEFPNVSGKIEISDADAQLKYLFGKLDHIFADIIIKDNIIDIYTMKADTEKGTLKITNLDEKKGGTMKWIRPYEANWRVTNIGDKIKFSDTPYMEFIDGDADVDLAVTGLLDSPMIAGAVKISDMRYRFPVKMRTKTGEAAEIKDNYAQRITWDLKIAGTGDNNYFFDDDFVNSFAQVYLKFGDKPVIMQGRGEGLKISGNIGITRGTYKYMSTEFQVDPMKESKILFDGQKKPVLDVYATSQLKVELAKGAGGGIELPGINSQHAETQGPQDISVSMHAWGRVGDVNMDVTSEPSIERNRLLYILTFGQDANSISQDAALTMATSLANGWIKGQTEQLKRFAPGFNIDVKVGQLVQAQPTPDTTGKTTNAEGTVKMELGLGKYITSNLYLDYRMKLLEGQSLLNPTYGLNLEHTLGVDYSLNPTSKLEFNAIIRDPNYYINPISGYVGIKTGMSFDSYGAKPTPTPTPGKKGK